MLEKMNNLVKGLCVENLCNSVVEEQKCTFCNGAGEVEHAGNEYTCKHCNGTGVIEVKKYVKNTIADNSDLVNKVNSLIKTEIVKNKNTKARGINAKQHTAIVNLYMTITESVMSLTQIEYLKIINSIQASSIIYELNTLKRNLK